MTGFLIFIGLILVILNVLSIKKQNRSFNGALGNALENIGEDDIKLGELRREFSESILELQSEIMYIKEIMENNNKLHKNYPDNLQERKYDVEKIEEMQTITIASTINSSSNGEKVGKIKNLFSQGLSEDEVSEIMHLGKGEVLLIKDLYIK